MHMVRYQVKPERLSENEELVRAVLAQLDEVRPAGLSYVVLKLDDGVTFIHLIDHDDAQGSVPGAQLDSLRAFHAGLRERCEDAPVRTAVFLVGSFGLLQGADPATPVRGTEPA